VRTSTIPSCTHGSSSRRRQGPPWLVIEDPLSRHCGSTSLWLRRGAPAVQKLRRGMSTIQEPRRGASAAVGRTPYSFSTVVGARNLGVAALCVNGRSR
jgi:hypothetical protein